MKMNIKGLVFVGFAAAVFASAANAAIPEGDAAKKAVTSVSFTETTYQKKIAAGDNITIAADGKTISAKDTTYTAGTGINIDANNAISATGDITAYTGAGDTTVENHVITTNVPVKGIKTHGADNPITPDSNGIVELPAERTVNDGRLSIKVGNNEAQTFTANTAGDTSVVLGAAAGADLAASIADNEQGLTSGDQVYDFVTDKIDDLTEYAASTNVTFTPNATTGKTEISAKDTTYAAGDHVTISGTNNAIGVTVNGTIAENDTGIVSGGTVYNYLNSSAVQSDYSQDDSTKPDFIKNKPTIGDATITIQQGSTTQTFTVNDTSAKTITIAEPWTAPAAGTCTDANPCALVLGTSGTPTWEPIAQP